MEWQPATVEEVQRIVAEDLKRCDAEQLAAFKIYAVKPYSAPIVRYGEAEYVAVVARRNDEVIYWDVEEGFQVSPIGPNDCILQHCL